MYCIMYALQYVLLSALWMKCQFTNEATKDATGLNVPSRCDALYQITAKAIIIDTLFIPGAGTRFNMFINGLSMELCNATTTYLNALH